MASGAIGCERAHGATYERTWSLAGTEDDAAKASLEPTGECAIGERMSHEHSVHDVAVDVYSRQL